MIQLEVGLKQRSYPIYIEKGLLNRALSDNIRDYDQVAVITNETVSELYLNSFLTALNKPDIKVLIAPDSEQAKSIEVYTDLISQLIEANFSRSSLLLALGGGVIGDLTGFIAATLHRGCRLIQIPTTLLSQVDSSVGGKTAINHAAGKNLIGSFYQPEAVIIDPDTLSTLPPREFAAGMAEVIKYGFVSNDDFFLWLENNKQAIKAHDSAVLAEMIRLCCQYKAEVVSKDELEQGQRALLNLGHTFGHAIEQVAGYGEWLHGEAVAVGMLLAMRLANDEGLCDKQLYHRLASLLAYFDLPVKLKSSLSVTSLAAAMQKDKKNLDQTLRLVLPTALGNSIIRSWNDDEVIASLWCEFGATR